MRILICLLVVLITVRIGSGRKYSRCEFLEYLEKEEQIERVQAVIWTCLAEKLTSIDTKTVVGTDDEKYYGLFQINEKYWCSRDAAGCALNCSKLLDDDVSDDLKCAQLIYNETVKISGNGFTAWPTYEGCKGQEETYLKSCNLELNTIDGNVDVLKGGEFKDKEDDDRAVKIYDKCDLARELYMTHGFSMDMVAPLVCIVNHESHFNSSAIGQRNMDGSFDYGMFQISDKYWCSREEQLGGACNMQCKDLLDNDITDDVRCVKLIYEETSKFSETGFDAWVVYNRNESDCKNDSKAYIAGCFEDIISQNAAPMPPTQRAFGVCELYEELKDQVPEEDVANYMCIAYHESHLITSSTRKPGHHGIFQINEDRWCRKKSESMEDGAKGCPVFCDQLRDTNITDDIKCAKNVKALLGFDVWSSYSQHCKGKSEVFVSKCRPTLSNSVDVEPSPVKPYPRNPFLWSITSTKAPEYTTKSQSPPQVKDSQDVNLLSRFGGQEPEINVNQNPVLFTDGQEFEVREGPQSLSLPHYLISFMDPFQRLRATFEIEKSVLDGGYVKIAPILPSESKKGGLSVVIEKDPPMSMMNALQ